MDRWPALNRRVLAARSAAWIFMPPTAAAIEQFGSTVDIQGPGGLSESTFLSDLQLDGVAYRVVHAGLVQAVIPSRAVTPGQVGLTSTG